MAPLKRGNPLGMKELMAGGPFVLPPMPCSSRRTEYFRRNNRFLATYATLIAFAGQGQEVADAYVAAHQTSCGDKM